LNIGTGKATSISPLPETLKAIYGLHSIRPKYATPRKGDVSRSVADITKAKRTLGYVPKTSLRTDLREDRVVESMFRRYVVYAA
jgi:UDP-glucose 4-epimerase